MNTRLVLFFALLLCPLAHAQERILPDAPKPKVSRKVFLTGVSLLAASTSADMWSTKRMLEHGGTEGNPIFGRHPSTARLSGISAANFLVESTGFYFTERSRHAWVRWAGRAYLILDIEEHTRFAACNSARSRNVARGCRPVIPF